MTNVAAMAFLELAGLSSPCQNTLDAGKPVIDGNKVEMERRGKTPEPG
jgi:hypothetical protein